MFDNIGNKIKGIAKVIVVIGSIVAFFLGIILTAETDKGGYLLITFFGPVLIWIVCIALCVLGELAENSQENNEMLAKISKQLEQLTKLEARNQTNKTAEPVNKAIRNVKEEINKVEDNRRTLNNNNNSNINNNINNKPINNNVNTPTTNNTPDNLIDDKKEEPTIVVINNAENNVLLNNYILTINDKQLNLEVVDFKVDFLNEAIVIEVFSTQYKLIFTDTMKKYKFYNTITTVKQRIENKKFLNH